MTLHMYVWESPVPNDSYEARDIVENLREDIDAPPSPKLDQLLAALWERYPCDSESQDPARVWTTLVRRRRDPNVAVLSIGISKESLHEAQHFLINAANGLGLVACDSSFRTVHLPSDWVFGSEL